MPTPNFKMVDRLLLDKGNAQPSSNQIEKRASHLEVEVSVSNVQPQTQCITEKGEQIETSVRSCNEIAHMKDTYREYQPHRVQ